MTNRERQFDWGSVLFWAYVALLLWIPIPLGSNRPWSWAVLEVGVFVMVAAWFALWTVGRVAVPDSLRGAWPAFALLAAWLCEQALHLVPLPSDWVSVLSPEAFRTHLLAGDLGAATDYMTLSIDPRASHVSMLKSLAYAGAFFLALALLNRRSRIRLVAQALVYAAVVLSIYAVLMHLAGARQLFLGAMIPHVESASGTFPNRNHFAGYLEMTLALGIGLLISGLSDQRFDNWKRFVRMTAEWILSPR